MIVEIGAPSSRACYDACERSLIYLVFKVASLKHLKVYVFDHPRHVPPFGTHNDELVCGFDISRYFGFLDRACHIFRTPQQGFHVTLRAASRLHLDMLTLVKMQSAGWSLLPVVLVDFCHLGFVQE